MVHIEPKTYFIRTFGCQMNVADSERLAGYFEKKGYKLAKDINSADLVVVNSCSVRESAENRVFGLIRNLRGDKKQVTGNRKIILTGCMVGSAKGERRRYTLPQLRQRLPKEVELKTLAELMNEPFGEAKKKKSAPAYLKIMEGCDHFCTYCVVPYARGKEVSRSFDEIICEAETLAKNGVRELVLLGQNVNSYGDKSGGTFAKLLGAIHDINGIDKISFFTSNPWDLSDGIIEAMKLPKVDRYLHLALQSGDDKILKRMNRGYTAKDFLNLVKKIRKEIPDIKIGTDIIVGFPGENKKAFQDTVDLCKKIGFVRAYVSRYSVRPGTAATEWPDDVSPAEKRRCWQVLNKLINENGQKW